jgi:hypothetical protein
VKRSVLFLFVLAVVAALGVGAAMALAGNGNSGNAKLCQQGGWQTVARSDGSSFSNQDDCTSYGAHGGMILIQTTT